MGTTAGLVVITATVVALLAAIGYVWHGRPDEPRPDARASVAVPDGGSELFLDGGDLWVYSRGASASAPEPQDQELRRVVGPDLDVVASATVAEGISEVAVVAGSVWIETGTRGQLAEVDPATGQLLRTVDTGLDVTSLAAGSDGELWVGLYDLRAFPSDIAMGSVAVLDTRSGELEPRLAVESAPLRMVADGQVLWMVRNDGTVARVDTRQAEQVNPDEASGSGSPAPGVTLAGPVTMLDGEPTPVDWNPVDVVLADGSVWVADGSSGRVYRLDPDSGEVVADTAVGVNVGVTPERVLSARDTDVWVHAYQEVVRIDTRTTEVAGRVEVPYLSESIVDDDDLWGVSSDGDEDVLERWDLADVLEPA